ncbi:MAG: hypothetical protein IPH12_19645 [Saprospirales bacterium]|jgi:hypothetical protein|nr:hypothetical protein [Saprospirales bacterium]MBK8921666.1 hypothetical protein [Saprospirales bacterium]
MDPLLRKRYNAAFTQEKYQAFLQSMNTEFGEAISFRVAETPVFVPKALKTKILQGVGDITEVLIRPDFREKSEAAIPPQLRVPKEDPHPVFLQLDFGICRGADGQYSPQLIELQGFPSLYFYQHLLAQGYRKHFDIPADYHHLFGGIDRREYLELLRHVIIGDSHPENVVLLEIEPEKQNTRIDFWGGRKYLGLKVLCLSKVKREGRDLFYLDEFGRKVSIERIYNRIIFDELEKRADLPREWDMFTEVNAEWVGHPNWFFRMSKHTLPFLQSEFVPETHFVSALKTWPADLENWVLKPLFSFSGQGVKVNITREDLESVDDPGNFILQRKVEYVAAIETATPNEPAKCEIRMMMLWDKGWERPLLVNNLVRMSKGEMVGVRYNMGKEWVGSTVAFFEP